jgi:DtxR family Mn-dependent transcriptional regulator
VGRPLSDAPVDQALRIVHIEDEPEAVYRQIQAEALYLGSGVRILERTPTRIRFWSDGGEHVLAPSLANNVSVVPVPETQAKKLLEEMAAHEHLSALAFGRRARVLGLSPACRGPERRRLMDLGFVPGTEVKAVLSSPTGDPVAYELRGTLIALRHEQAGLVDVTFIEEKAA